MSISKDLNVNHSDSEEHELTPNTYLPGGTLITIFGSLSSYVVEASKTSDKLGQWNAIKLKHEKKIIIVINLHRTPDGPGRGLKTCLSQHNRTTVIEHTARKHRKDLLKDIKKYLHEINEDKEIIIAGDFDQATGGDEMQRFYREIGVKDALWCHDHTPWNVRDVTFKRGSRCIDTIAISDGLMICLEGHEVIDWDEKIKNDHRGHAIDLNLEDFFQESVSKSDCCNRTRLDPGRSSHR